MRTLLALTTAVMWLCTMPAMPTIAAESDAAVEIPLKDIWALRMKGTRPMSPGIGDPEHPEGPLLNDIRIRLPFLTPGKEPRLGFAVQGKDMDALARAHSILVKDAPPPQVLRADEPVTAVFFSHLLGSYVRIVRVWIRGQIVEIDYQFIPHMTMQMTYHFALIPLGHLEPGQYEVHVRHVDKRGTVALVEASPVCRSYMFTVRNRRESPR